MIIYAIRFKIYYLLNNIDASSYITLENMKWVYFIYTVFFVNKIIKKPSHQQKIPVSALFCSQIS